MARRNKPGRAYTRPFAFGTTQPLAPSFYTPPATTQVIWKWGGTTAEFSTATMIPTANFNNYTVVVTPPGTLQQATAPYTDRFSGNIAVALQTGGVGTRVRFTCNFVNPITGAAAAQAGGTILIPIIDTATGASLVVPDRFVIRYRIPWTSGLKIGFILHNGGTAGLPPRSYTGPPVQNLPAVQGTLFGFGVANLSGTAATETNRAESPVTAINEYPFTSAGGTFAGVNIGTTATPAVGATFEDEVVNQIATASTAPIPYWGHQQLIYVGSLGAGNTVARPTDLVGAAPVAGWTNKTGLNQLGVLIISNRTTGTSAFAELADITVFKHPLDVS